MLAVGGKATRGGEARADFWSAEVFVSRGKVVKCRGQAVNQSLAETVVQD